MRKLSSIAVIFALVLWSPISSAHTGPEAGARSYAQNYKDMVLVTCITNAYASDKNAAKDAGSSVSALIDWTEYDFDKSPDAVKSLVNRYLSRDYFNPLVESEMKGVKFDMLKCLDMYHSKELDTLTQKLVGNPDHTYEQDNKE